MHLENSHGLSTLIVLYTYIICSDELLLQEDGPDVGSMVSEFTNIMRISHPPDPAVPVAGMGRFNNTYQTHMNSHIPNQR